MKAEVSTKPSTDPIGSTDPSTPKEKEIQLNGSSENEVIEIWSQSEDLQIAQPLSGEDKLRRKLEGDFQSFKNVITYLYVVLTLKRPVDFAVLCGLFFGLVR